MAMRSKSLLLAAMSMVVMGNNLVEEGTSDNDVEESTKMTTDSGEKVKRYYFNAGGECEEGQHLVYFDVINSNTAKEAFDLWLKNKYKD